MSDKIFENFEEATKYSLTIPWKINVCNSGEDCWCRVVLPDNPIKYKHITSVTKEKVLLEINYIIPDGSVDKDTVEYIVDMHNEKVKNGD